MKNWQKLPVDSLHHLEQLTRLNDFLNFAQSILFHFDSLLINQLCWHPSFFAAWIYHSCEENLLDQKKIFLWIEVALNKKWIPLQRFNTSASSYLTLINSLSFFDSKSLVWFLFNDNLLLMKTDSDFSKDETEPSLWSIEDCLSDNQMFDRGMKALWGLGWRTEGNLKLLEGFLGDEGSLGLKLLQDRRLENPDLFLYGLFVGYNRSTWHWILLKMQEVLLPL